MAWDKRQVREFVRLAKEPWGSRCWTKLSREHREALIDSAVLSIVRAQRSLRCIPVDEVDDLYFAMRSEALEEDE
jgi:hypothetical protein